MKNASFLFSVLLFAGAVASCSESGDTRRWAERMESVWQQSDTDLDEATRRAAVLADSLADMPAYAQNRYKQLCIRLRDKQNLVPTNPDSARQNLDYFLRHGSDTDRERAYFYLGRAYRELKDYPRATVNFLRGIEQIENGAGADTVIWQSSLSQPRYLSLLQLRYDEELDVARKALSLAKKSGVHVGWHLMDVASAYKHLRDTLSCLRYCDSAYAVLMEQHFPGRYAPVLAHQLALYSDYGRFERVDTLLTVLSELPSESRPKNYELCLAMYYEHSRQVETAIEHFRKYYGMVQTTEGRYEAAAGLQRCFMKKGDYRQAALWGASLYEANDTIIAQSQFEQTQRAMDEYRYYQDQEAETEL